ncbi:hypothetical protein C4F40_15270 [Sphingobacterium sp. Ka21]|uniref:Uncharacterized protein n=2 Tax=Sphingobacterium pedocola TaxID=2082722 RepID=A0ABR9T9R6_9SPHI|nr:hypothetical protein [Sphingobacterium pedocola]
MMKIPALLLLGVCFSWTVVHGQTAIEKLTVDGGGVLDFASGTTKGIILPAVATLPSTPANGTFLYDKNAQMVKMFANGAWVNLSDEGDNSAVLPYSGTAAGTQTVIGAKSTTVDGVLVLEATDKALVLPKVASPHLNVPGPYPGMMCYDTDAKALAVYDGTVWSYWK